MTRVFGQTLSPQIELNAGFILSQTNWQRCHVLLTLSLGRIVPKDRRRQIVGRVTVICCHDNNAPFSFARDTIRISSWSSDRSQYFTVLNILCLVVSCRPGSVDKWTLSFTWSWFVNFISYIPLSSFWLLSFRLSGEVPSFHLLLTGKFLAFTYF
jgi:hypothetical protein